MNNRKLEEAIMRLFLMITFLVQSFSMRAHTMEELWHNMPSTVEPLAKSARVDTLCANYMSLSINDVERIEILLTKYQSDTAICFVRTIFGPAEESEVFLYDTRWNKLGEVKLPEDELVIRPDTMDVQHFETLKLLLEPRMVKASVDKDDDMLNISLTLPLVNEDEKKKLAAILRQRKVKFSDIVLKQG